jgi:predicted  nucleic acid-binding Zn-ribbon protein
MISSRKCQLVITLILFCFCVPVLGVEVNEPKTELKFEISNEEMPWLHGTREIAKHPIKPRYMAELFIWNLPEARFMTRSGSRPRRPTPPRVPQLRPRQWSNTRPDIDFASPQMIKTVLDTSAGQSMSELQREFVTLGYALLKIGDFSDKLPNYHQLGVYAVSQDDAEKMVKAFIEVLTNEAKKELVFWQSERQRLGEGIPDTNKKISEIEEQEAAAQNKLDELKRDVHYLSTDEAKETVLDLNKKLNSLEVEIAGLQAKVSTIEEHIEKYRGRNATREPAFAKLEEMLNIQTVDLAGALASKEASTKIRNQAQEFCDLHLQLTRLPKTKSYLSGQLRASEHGLSQVEKKLADPSPDILPPKVFQNEVTIYRVPVKE